MSDLERSDRALAAAKMALTLADLRREGPPIRLRELASLTGFTKEKFYDAIERGELQPLWILTGQTRMIMVERLEALRYLQQIRFAA